MGKRRRKGFGIILNRDASLSYRCKPQRGAGARKKKATKWPLFASVLKKQTIILIPVINASRKCKQKLLKLTKTHLKPFKDLNGDKTLPLAAFPVCLWEVRMFWLLLVAYQ